MPDRAGTLGGRRRFAINLHEEEEMISVRAARERKRKEAVEMRKKYRSVLRLIPYYPKTTTSEHIRKKLGLNDSGLLVAVNSLDKAGVLIIWDGGYLSRLREDLSNVY